MIETKVKVLNDILDNFKIGAVCIGYHAHRHFYYYDVQLEPGYKLNKLMGYAAELGLALNSAPPIIKPMNELGCVRMHFSACETQLIDFKKIYNNKNAPKDYFLPFLLGETDLGTPLWVDMSKNPHMLIGGASGSGKSVFLHVLIKNALALENTELFLVDTKKVEFSQYSSFKNVKSIDKDYYGALRTIDKLIDIMEQRFEILSNLGVNNIESVPYLSRILFIMDEFADLTLIGRGKEFENRLIKLAAKSRAAGIYCVLATQRPSTNVVTGLIKANFSARVGFKTSSSIESKIILDSTGAEKLVGHGDGLLKTSIFDNVRFQSAF